MIIILRLLFLSTFVALAAPCARAQAPGLPSPKTLRVATRIIPPFVTPGADKAAPLEGFSMDLWRSLEDELHLKATLSVQPNVASLLAAVRSGKADLGIAAISITSERDKDFDFSQPMFDAGLQILVRDQSHGGSAVPSIVSVLLSPNLRQALVIVLVIILLPAHLIWLIERNHPEGIVENKAYFPGILKALWWSAGTLGAQADEMPKSALGRLIAVLWMFSGIAFVAYFTAVVTSSMTVQQLHGDINGPEDLPGKRVATTTGSTSATYLRQQHAHVITFPAIEGAYESLLNKQADAVVFDSPVLLYYAAHEGKGKVQVVGEVFRKENYGIVFPTNSRYRKPVNTALLAIKENGTYDALYDKWFGTKNE